MRLLRYVTLLSTQLHEPLILQVKYINSKLKRDFDLDSTFKLKPVAEPDNLLLLLVQHWAQNEHAFLTEDNWLDVATILLFQFYTEGQSAEFVHSSKNAVSEDPLEKAEIIKNKWPQKQADKDDQGSDADNDYEYNNNSNTGDGPVCDNNIMFNFDENEENIIADGDDLVNQATDKTASHNSSYGNGRTDVSVTEDIDDHDSSKFNEFEEPVQENCNTIKLDEFEEATQKYKALCYKDICLWIVKNLKIEERDVLAMKVYLWHHKEVNNKPKLYVLFVGF